MVAELAAPPVPTFDASPGAEALDAMLPYIRAVPPDALAPRRVHVDKALVGARRVYGRIVELGLLERMRAGIGGEELDHARIDRFEALSDALQHAHRRVKVLTANRRRARLPKTLVVRAETLRGRMRRLLEYHLEEHPVIGPRLEGLRVGNGYLRLANALDTYADLYVEHIERVKRDPSRFRSTDVEDARQVAVAIRRILAFDRNDELDAWRDLRDRAWALWLETYEDITETARWLLRTRPERREIVSAVTLARARPKRVKPVGREAEADETEEPVPEEAEPSQSKQTSKVVGSG